GSPRSSPGSARSCAAAATGAERPRRAGATATGAFRPVRSVTPQRPRTEFARTESPMLTGGQLAALIVAVFWAVLVSFIALTLLKLSRLLAEAGKVVRDIGDQAAPLLDDMTHTVKRANEQLGRTDVITKQV